MMQWMHLQMIKVLQPQILKSCEQEKDGLGSDSKPLMLHEVSMGTFLEVGF
jgi:hypothetical protein